MSDIEFGRFVAAAGKDPEAARALVLAVGDKQGEDAIEAVAAFARARGFAVTAEDAAKARRSAIAACETSRDLMDDELDGVEGGALLETALLVGVLGLGAAAVTGTGAVVGVAGVGLGLSILPLIPDPAVEKWLAQW